MPSLAGLRLLEKKTIPSNTTSVTFSGLNYTENDGSLILIGKMIGNDTATGYRFFINGDETDANYLHIGATYHSVNGITLTNSAQAFFTGIAIAGTTTFEARAELINSKFSARILSNRDIHSSASDHIGYDINVTKPASSVTSITSITIKTLVANQIGAGSILELYQLSTGPGNQSGNLSLIDRPSGLSWLWVNTETIRMTPAGTDGRARIPTTSGVSGDLSVESVSSSLDCVINVPGPGGLHSGFSESSNVGYNVYYISGPLVQQSLIAVPVGTAFPSGGASLPSGYTRYSKVISFFHNDGSSNIRQFSELGGVYLHPTVSVILSAGTATTLTPLDISQIVPDYDAWVLLENFSTTSGSGSADFQIYGGDPSSTGNQGYSRHAVSSGSPYLHVTPLWIRLGDTQELTYKWFITSGSPTRNGSLRVKGFQIGL